MRRSWIVLAVIVLVVAVVGLWYFSSPTAKDMFRQTQTITDQNQTNKLVLGYVGNPYTDDYQNSRIPGYMQNQSNQQIAAVNVEVDLYNSKGDRKEIVKYTIKDIPPGTRKTFDANAGTLDGPRNAKVKIISVEVVK